MEAGEWEKPNELEETRRKEGKGRWLSDQEVNERGLGSLPTLIIRAPSYHTRYFLSLSLFLFFSLLNKSSLADSLPAREKSRIRALRDDRR